MSNFERRLNVVQRRPVEDDASNTVRDGASSVAWLAAERISHLPGIDPGTVIKVDVASGDDTDTVASIEVRWDAAGVPLIHEGLPVRRGQHD